MDVVEEILHLDLRGNQGGKWYASLNRVTYCMLTYCSQNTIMLY